MSEGFVPLIRNRPYLFASLALLALGLFYTLIRPWGMIEDYWETAAAIRAVAENPLHPLNPLLALGEHTSPRFVPYTIVWGIFMKLTGLGVIAVMALAGMTNLVLFLTGVYRFVIRQWNRCDLPLFALGAMLLLWGKGYSQANAYQLDILLISLPFTGIFTFALCFHALAELKIFVDNQKLSRLLMYTLLASAAFVTHPITAMFLFVGAFAMLFERKQWLELIALQLVPLVALGAALLWPYFDYWTVLFKGSTESWFYMPMFSNRPLAIGTAFVGVPVLAYYALRREQLFLIIAAVICGVAYLISDALQILIGARFLFWAMVYTQLAVAIFAYERDLLKWSTLRESLMGNGIIFALVFVVLLPCLAFRANEMRKYAVQGLSSDQSVSADQRVPDPFLFLSDYLDSGDIVMADIVSGWPLPAITGARIVAQQKGNPLMQAEVERRQEDARRFFTREMPLAGRHLLLTKYHCTHVVWSDNECKEWDPNLRSDLEQLCRVVVSRPPVTLYEVRP